MNENKFVDIFNGLINQILEMPDLDFETDEVRDGVLTIVDEAFTEEMIEEAVHIKVDDYRARNLTQEEALEEFESFKNTTGNLLEGMTESEMKKELLFLVFNKFCFIIETSIEMLQGYKGIPVYFQKLRGNARIPTYAHPTDAGMDIYAPEHYFLPPHSFGNIVPTGLAAAIKTGYFLDIRPRSGLSAKTAVRVANSPGTIDESYREEIGVILDNFGDEGYNIEAGDRIAQFVLMPKYIVDPRETDNVKAIGENRNGGFGSTGK